MKPTVIAAAIFTALIDLVSAANLEMARNRSAHWAQGQIEREGRRLQSHLSPQRREGRRGRMDDAAVHGPRNMGCIHRDKRWSNGDGRYGFV